MMKMLSSPLVYVGPTLTPDEVAQALPNAIIRPPIGRGDLYRDRTLRGTVFLILDGVFFQQRAVSPREIRDVIADGAVVVGAASMGALRAAECWPLGMRGVGSIYRLFRAGVLTADDEVAVAFDAERPERGSSVALVNVRYAVWQATRARLLSPDLATRILTVASGLFYSERHWPAILERAGALDDGRSLARALAGYDLKRLDALRALGRVQRWQAKGSEFHRRPRGTRPFTFSEDERERGHDAFLGQDALPLLGRIPTGVGAPGGARSGSGEGPRTDSLRTGWGSASDPHGQLSELSRWLVASGRYRRYVGGPAPKGARARAPRVNADFIRWLDRRGSLEPDEGKALLERWGLRRDVVAQAAHAARRNGDFTDEWGFNEDEARERLIAAIAVRGELDAELFRHRAVARLAAAAKALGLTPTALDRHQAEQQIAFEHEHDNWERLLQTAVTNAPLRTLLTTYRDLLSLAYASKRAEAAGNLVSVGSADVEVSREPLVV